LNLGPFIAAGWAHEVLVAGKAGAVDAEVEAGVDEAEVPVEAVGGHVGVPASWAIVGPVTDRAGGTPGSVSAAGTSRHCLLTHAGKPSTSAGPATGLPGDDFRSALAAGWPQVCRGSGPGPRAG